MVQYAMGDISVILSFVHPLATVLLATLWTLHILRKDYADAIEELEPTQEKMVAESTQPQGE